MVLDPSSSLFIVQGLQNTVLPYMLFLEGKHEEQPILCIEKFTIGWGRHGRGIGVEGGGW